MTDHQENTTTSTNPYVSSPRGYALSGKIMLIAIIILFAVVLIMVCVHIYARCYILRARRRRHRRTHLVFYIDHPQNQPNTVIHTQKLDPAILKSLPTFTFSKAADDTAEMVSECAVCLSDFEPSEKVRSLPKCKHCFHVECIDMWFYTHSTCPLCRAPVEAPDNNNSELVLELGESTQSQPGSSELVVGTSSRKGIALLEVPMRSQSFTFTNSGGSGPSRSPGLRSPTSRILSLKRILSREKRSPLSSPSGAGSSCELDVELGRVDSPSQSLSPS